MKVGINPVSSLEPMKIGGEGQRLSVVVHNIVVETLENLEDGG